MDRRPGFESWTENVVHRDEGWYGPLHPLTFLVRVAILAVGVVWLVAWFTRRRASGDFLRALEDLGTPSWRGGAGGAIAPTVG